MDNRFPAEAGRMVVNQVWRDTEDEVVVQK